jgi:branched-chain amino acid transport system substrate-binding protein
LASVLCARGYTLHLPHNLTRRTCLRLLGASAVFGTSLASACRTDSGAPPASTAPPASSLPPLSGLVPPAQASDASAGTLTIGLLAPLSGVYATLGAQMRAGLHLSLQHVGNTVAGRTVSVVEGDETTDVPAALRAIQRLVEHERVDVLTGMVTTPVAYAARDYLHAQQCVTVCLAGGNELTRSLKSPYVFRAGASAHQIGRPAGVWAAANIGQRAVTVAPDDDYGRELGGAFMDGFRSAGGEIVGNLQPKVATADYGPFLPQLVAARPHLVFVFAAGADAVTFTTQFNQFGANGDVLLFGTGDYVEESSLATEGVAALGARSASPWAWGIDSPENKRLLADVASLDAYAVQQYDATRFIVEAVNATHGNTQDARALVRALEGVTFTSPRGPIAFDPATHNLVQNVYIRAVKEVGSGLHNVVLDTLQSVRDPG